MTTLVSTDGQLIPDGGGPYQLTSSGQRSLSRSSMPFAIWVNGGTVDLLGENRTVSYSQIYRTQPWIAAAVNKRYRPIVRLPLKVYSRNSQGDKVRVLEGRAVDLVTKPWKRGHQGSLKQQLYAPVYTHGNSVTGIVRDGPGQPPSGLKPLDWRWLQPIWNGMELVAWRTIEFGAPEYYAPEDVIHRTWWAPDGPIGVSPLQQLGVMIRLEDAAQRHQASLLLNGARGGSAIEMPADMPPNIVEKLPTLVADMREDIERIQAGPENSGRPWMLPPGFKLVEAAFNAQEAELIATRKVNREEAAAVLDVPPSMLGILDKANYSNLESQYGNYYTDHLGPDIVLGEQDLNAQLFDHPAFEGQFVEFDLAGVLRGKKLEEIQALREAVSIALTTPNEGRSVLNLPVFGDPADDNNPANKLYMPSNNLTPLGAAPADSPPAPPEDPAVPQPV